MALFLDILQGTSAGERFPLTEGLKVGRTEGEIRIRDSKISALHARVEKDEKGQLYLVDENSTNGLRVEGKRRQKVLLEPGLKFLIGKTLVRVLEYERERVATTEPPKNWKDLLIQQLRSTALADVSGPAALPSIRAFNPAVLLTVKTGIQAKKAWILGFGPREFGAEGLEIELFEPTTPDLAFTLAPEDGAARFETNYPEIVFLNEKAISSDILREGDQIRIGDSLIEVSFVK